MKLLREIIGKNTFAAHYAGPEEVKSNFVLAGKLTQHYSALIKPEHELGREKIAQYTHESYLLNSHLWGKHENREKYRDESDLEKTAGHINKTLSSFKAPHDLTVWSSTRHDPRVKKNSEGVVHHPAFLSTSIYRPVAMNRNINDSTDKNGNTHLHVLKIHIPEGSPGAYVDHISKIRGEYEHILPSGSNLQYHKTDSTKKKNRFTEKWDHTHIHTMSLIK